MQAVQNLSVVIPSAHTHNELLKVVIAVCSQTVKPKEIVIVDSSKTCTLCPLEITTICNQSEINVIYKHVTLAMPGRARNIGLLLSTGEYIGFIDVQTIPRPDWLELAMSIIFKEEVSGIWGATCFSAVNRFELLVRDGFYGVLPRRTLPGSVFKRAVFAKAGQFIDWVRAGEDTEWMLRLEILKVPVATSSIFMIDYVGLIGSNIKKLLKKWFQNYKVSRDLPHFFPQRLLLWLLLYPMLVLIAFNWNYLVADWRMDSPLYLGHVTKIVAVLPIFLYILIRGIFLPIRRGLHIKQLFPIRFLMIISICFLTDLIKIIVFSLPKHRIKIKNKSCEDNNH